MLNYLQPKFVISSIMESAMVDEKSPRCDGGGYAIETRMLSKVYDSVKVVNELDLRIPRNSIIGFLGARVLP
jgi:hypothetical protein